MINDFDNIKPAGLDRLPMENLTKTKEKMDMVTENKFGVKHIVGLIQVAGEAKKAYETGVKDDGRITGGEYLLFFSPVQMLMSDLGGLKEIPNEAMDKITEEEEQEIFDACYVAGIVPTEWKTVVRETWDLVNHIKTYLQETLIPFFTKKAEEK